MKRYIGWCSLMGKSHLLCCLIILHTWFPVNCEMYGCKLEINGFGRDWNFNKETNPENNDRNQIFSIEMLFVVNFINKEIITYFIDILILLLILCLFLLGDSIISA